MAIVKPFKGVRPPKALVENVQSRPYDVLNSEEARAEAGDNEIRRSPHCSSATGSPGTGH